MSRWAAVYAFALVLIFHPALSQAGIIQLRAETELTPASGPPPIPAGDFLLEFSFDEADHIAGTGVQSQHVTYNDLVTPENFPLSGFDHDTAVVFELSQAQIDAASSTWTGLL